MATPAQEARQTPRQIMLDEKASIGGAIKRMEQGLWFLRRAHRHALRNERESQAILYTAMIDTYKVLIVGLKAARSDVYEEIREEVTR